MCISRNDNGKRPNKAANIDVRNNKATVTVLILCLGKIDQIHVSLIEFRAVPEKTIRMLTPQHPIFNPRTVRCHRDPVALL